MERLSMPSSQQQVRGFLTIHSAPAALRHHIDWAIQAILGNWIKPNWKSQPLMPGTFRTSLEFRDGQGSAAQLASALRSWHYLNFEVVENTEQGGELFRFTPELGIHRSLVDMSGAVLLTENQLNAVLKNTFDEDSIRDSLANLLGDPWEVELDRFRGVDLQETAHLRAI